MTSLRKAGINYSTFHRLVRQSYLQEGVHFEKRYTPHTVKVSLFDTEVEFVKSVITKHCRGSYRRDY